MYGLERNVFRGLTFGAESTQLNEANSSSQIERTVENERTTKREFVAISAYTGAVETRRGEIISMGRDRTEFGCRYGNKL